MAAVAPCPQIVEIQSEVWPISDGKVMVCVEVACPPVVTIAQLREDPVRWWDAQFKPAEVTDDIRFPTAIHAPPTIALEAQDP